MVGYTGGWHNFKPPSPLYAMLLNMLVGIVLLRLNILRLNALLDELNSSSDSAFLD